MTRKTDDYDWLNDPFDEKKTAEEIERTRGTKAAGVLLVVVVLLAVGLVGFAIIGIAGALTAGA